MLFPKESTVEGIEQFVSHCLLFQSYDQTIETVELLQDVDVFYHLSKFLLRQVFQLELFS